MIAKNKVQILDEGLFCFYVHIYVEVNSAPSGLVVYSVFRLLERKATPPWPRGPPANQSQICFPLKLDDN